jgi:TPR repeat protein
MTAADGAPMDAAPYATGGGGTVLEHRYGAVLLACLLTGDPVTELGDDATPVSVRFQASAVSPVDDLLVVGRTPDGGERRVSIGVRRAPALVASDDASARLFTSYLRIVTDSWEELLAGRWRLCLAVASPNAPVRQLRALAEIARACVDEPEFRAEVARPRRTNQGVRARLPHIDALVTAARAEIDTGNVGTGELTWRLLSSLWTRELRLEGTDQTDRTHAVQSLRAITPNRTAAAANELFLRLTELANNYAPAGAQVTVQRLRQDLSGTPLRPSPSPAGLDVTVKGAALPVTVWDAQLLGVHRAITADSVTGQALPELTPYVPRAHDTRLRELLAAPEHPVMLVIVGGSSTGKTRAAFEAVRACLPDWVLLSPLDVAELLAQLRSDAVTPRTVLWLNELQIYLRNQPDVAAALRRLLAGDEPVMVIGTMWPQFWKELTSRPAEGEQDANHQARELLQLADRVYVPETFTGHDLAELRRVLATDRRLAAAAEAAHSDGKVTQVLAGGPELVQRYEHPADAEDRFGKAVLTAAMDARRLGYESPIGTPFLEEAAPAYINPPDRVGAPADWFTIGLGHAAREIHGIAALTGHRDQSGVGPADGYVLHDYLDQYSRTARRGVLIPAAVWDALTAHAPDPADRTRLAQEAQRRGLYRFAVVLARPAAEAGDSTAMQLLAVRLDEAGHTKEAEEWLQRAAEAGNPNAVQLLAQRLYDKGDAEGAETILRTAADAGDTSAILSIAARMDETGHGEDAEQLLVQAAESGDTVIMERLAARFDEADRHEEAEGWLRRAAEAGDSIVMQQLADRLDQADRAEEAEMWLRRAAEVNGPFSHFVRLRLVQRLDETGRPDEAEEWLRRDIEAGEISNTMWTLAGRLDQADQAEEAEEAEVWRQRARGAGEYFALYFAIAEIEQSGGGLDDFEALLRPSAEAGDLFAMRTLAERFDEAGRGAEANQWLSDSAVAGNLNALHVLAGRLQLAGRGQEAEQVWRRIIEAGNIAGVQALAQQLEGTDPTRADNLRRYGIEPGGSTAVPW